MTAREFFGNQLTSVPAGLLDGMVSIFNLFALQQRCDRC